MSSVELKGLVQAYEGRRALNGLDLELRDGELFALLGASGCGKTTTLRCLAGLEIPQEGRVLIDGQDVTHQPASERGCALVFQNYALFPHFNVLENVAYGLMAYQYRRYGWLGKLLTLVRSPWSALGAMGQRKVVEALKVVEMHERQYAYPHQLSGGQQQRVALARALVSRPRLLLFDEPLGALDVQLRVKMRDEIRRLQRRSGLTALYVTHDQEEALAIADRLALMDGGRIVQEGTPQELYLHPRNRLVAKFLGLANIISARLEKGRLFFNPDLSLETPQLNSPKVQVMVAIRPGAITLEELGGEQVWRGVVEWITFLGSFTRYVVRVQELSLAVYRPLHASDLQLKVGCEVGVRIDPAEILLLPEE